MNYNFIFDKYLDYNLAALYANRDAPRIFLWAETAGSDLQFRGAKKHKIIKKGHSYKIVQKLSINDLFSKIVEALIWWEP